MISFSFSAKAEDKAIFCGLSRHLKQFFSSLYAAILRWRFFLVKKASSRSFRNGFVSNAQLWQMKTERKTVRVRHAISCDVSVTADVL